jgi:hypothetical protein
MTDRSCETVLSECGVEQKFDAICLFLTTPTVDMDDVYQPVDYRLSLMLRGILLFR